MLCLMLGMLLLSFIDPIRPSCNDWDAYKHATDQSAHKVKASNRIIDLMFFHKAVVSIVDD
jgi:hypothetical protein